MYVHVKLILVTAYSGELFMSNSAALFGRNEAADRQQRLGTVLRQRAEARPEPRPENKGRPDL